MPKYFLDTEFIEGFHKPFFKKKRHFIDLISIGIVCDDGREFYMVCSDYDFYKASEWVVDNVIAPIFREEVKGDARNHYTIDTFHKYYGAPVEQIKKSLLKFLGCYEIDQFTWAAPEGIEMYGYYADYDHVLFCSIFGKMIDLPRKFPMYTRDLKQIIDEKAASIGQLDYTKLLVSGTDWKVVAPIGKNLVDIDSWPVSSKLELLKSLPGYPKQDKEHNALDDAHWNLKLYNFLQSI